MATAALVPVSEYLTTIYEPDADYVDGVIEERNLGELDHSDLQSALVALLKRPEYLPYFHCNSEYRVQVASTRFRVPDVCLRKAGTPRERIGLTPPMLCIEILSPEDRIQRTMTKIQDYLAMGVPEVWLVFPGERSIQVFRGHTMTEHSRGELTIPGTPVKLALSDIFSVLDER